MHKARLIKRRLLISFLIICAIAMVYLYLVVIFMPKDTGDLGGAKYYSTQAYKKEQKNSIDLLFFGNSDVYAGVSPILMYQNSGISSFVCASPKETGYSLVNYVKANLKRQNPKLVVLDADCFYYKNDHYHGFNVQSKVMAIAPFFYHARWKELTISDFFTLPTAKADPLKGYLPNAGTSNYKHKDSFMQNPNAQPLEVEKSVVKCLKTIQELCKSENAQLMFMCLPTPFSWNNSKSNGVKLLAGSMGVPFLDLNDPSCGLELDFNHSFKDSGNHLNIQGAEVATRFLENYITSHYSLADHRGEEKYKSWDEIAKNYDYYVQRAKQ